MAASVLLVTEAGTAWPSGRIRALGYLDFFRGDNIDVAHATRSVPSLIRAIDQPTPLSRPLLALGGGRALAQINGVLARRNEAAIVRRARAGYDAIYLQKVASLGLVEALRASTRARLVYDLNDAVWLPSRASFAGGRIRDILRLVDAVTCDNPPAAEFARHYNPSVFIVPDPAQVELFDRRRAQFPARDSAITLGWVGSPATARNLYAIWEPLEALFREFDQLDLRLVGIGHDRRVVPPFEHVRWTSRPFYNQDEMIDEILQMDVGLFPMFDVEDSRMRGVLKATLYMSGGACVVASPVGQVPDLIKDGENGLLARDRTEWLQRLRHVIEDRAYRQRLGAAGLATVREQFTTRRCYERLRDVLLPATHTRTDATEQ